MTVVYQNDCFKESNSSIYHNTQEIAAEYTKRGYSIIPVRLKGKNPTVPEWQNLRLGLEDIDSLFREPINIGVLLGDASGGLVDIDLDDDDAAQFAPGFLPHTNMVFGRKSRPASHRLYRISNPGKPRKLSASSVGTIVELRSTGQQTVFPGSVHETGESITFEQDGEPGETTREALDRGIQKIALATVLSKKWVGGNRHSLALNMAGFLQKCGWQQEEVEHLVSAVTKKAGDAEAQDRLNAVRSTFEAARLGKLVSGRAALVDSLDDATVRDFEKWLGVQGSKASSVASDLIDLATDAGCADVFATEHDGSLIYSDSQSQWYLKNNQIFEPVSSEIVQGIAKRFLQEMAVSNPSAQSKALLSRGRINAVRELSRSQLRANTELFDTNKNIVGCPNGSLLGLDDGRPLHGEASSIVTRKLGTSFSSEAKCPIWETFLDTIFDGNDEVIKFLQRSVGYSLSGSTSEQVLFILVGKGANGKSTFLRALTQFMGDYGATLPMQTLMDQTFGSSQTNDLASLIGKRFVSASEGEASQKLAESKIKLMTGGDRIKCRQLYKDFFEFDPQFKLWLATNNLPAVSGSDEAVWRRIRVVEFPVSIPADKQDRDLTNKLIAELPGILNWAIEGYHNWRKNGLCAPDQVERATTCYRDENDIVQQWINACCAPIANHATSMKALYEFYSAWCEQSGIEPKPNSIFGKELNRKGFEISKRKEGNYRTGLALKSSGATPAPNFISNRKSN